MEKNNLNEEEERKKYETKYNIYHDKKELNRKSNIVIVIITILIISIMLIATLS